MDEKQLHEDWGKNLESLIKDARDQIEQSKKYLQSKTNFYISAQKDIELLKQLREERKDLDKKASEIKW